MVLDGVFQSDEIGGAIQKFLDRVLRPLLRGEVGSVHGHAVFLQSAFVAFAEHGDEGFGGGGHLVFRVRQPVFQRPRATSGFLSA